MTLITAQYGLMRGIRRFIWLAFALGTFASAAHAWTNHAWGTWLALNAMPDVRNEAAVRAEPLEKFLLEQGAALEVILQQEEQWARSKVRNYPARPEVLAYRFDPNVDPAELRRRFLMAVRVNPATPLPLQLQLLPGNATQAAQTAYATRPTMAWSELSLHKEEAYGPRKHVALRDGEWVSVLDVLATASDEPDLGMDSGLWSDSGTEHGRVYGFGPQPMSMRHSAHGDEAPFHMGFFHESASTYATANGLRRNYPEYRMHLWQSLARHALVNGHSYWGWRFAGWAMHYAQDMTQPYHASFLPNRHTVGVLWLNMLNIVGASGARQQAAQTIAARHQWLEQYQQQSLLAPLQKGEWEHPNLKPFTLVMRDAGRMALPETGLRDIVALQAYRKADELDALVTSSMATRHTADAAASWSSEALDMLLRDLSAQFGNVTRAVWRRLQ
jgi:hypothetical protein